MSLRDQNIVDRIRVLDIDGSYMISIIETEKKTNKFLNINEICFDNLWEAEEYLKDQLMIELPEKENDRSWRDYDYD